MYGIFTYIWVWKYDEICQFSIDIYGISKAGWWFQTSHITLRASQSVTKCGGFKHEFYFPQYEWIILPIDFHIIQDG